MPSLSGRRISRGRTSALALALVLSGFSGPVQAQEPVPTEFVDSVIVRYEPGVSIADSSGDPNGADKVLTNRNLELGQNLGLGYRTIEFNEPIPVSEAEKIAAELAGTPEVAVAEPNFTMRSLEDRSVTESGLWGLDLLDGTEDDQYSASSNGAGVNLYVVDSGIRATHSEFASATTTRIFSGMNYVDDSRGTNDCNGHGTHVAAIAAGNTVGVAKNANIYPLRVLRCDGTGEAAWTLLALNWILENHVRPAVVNLSIGAEGTSTSINEIVRQLINRGVVVVIASGNGSKNQDGTFKQKEDACNYSPAMTREAITVNSAGAGNPINPYEASFFSNYGECTDIYAPGFKIRSAYNSSDVSYAEMSGTSMAAPLVAGVAVNLLSENADLTPDQIWANISNSAQSNRINSGYLNDPKIFIKQPSFGWQAFTATPTTSRISPATQHVAGTVGSAVADTTRFTFANFGTAPIFSVSPSLPQGLSLNINSGVISGTPTSSVSSTIFTITANGNGKSSTASVTINVTDPVFNGSGAGAGATGGTNNGAPVAAPAPAAAPAVSGAISQTVGKRRVVNISVSAQAGSTTSIQIQATKNQRVAYQRAGKTRYRTVKVQYWKTVANLATTETTSVRVRSAGTYRILVNTPSGPLEGAPFRVR